MTIFVSGRARLTVLAAVLTLLGCGAGGGAGTSQSLAGVTVSDADNGRTVTIAPGQRLTVTLGSTYWTIGASSNPSVLRQVGQPVASPGSCPPGVGCGEVSATFAAVQSGRADVT